MLRKNIFKIKWCLNGRKKYGEYNFKGIAAWMSMSRTENREQHKLLLYNVHIIANNDKINRSFWSGVCKFSEKQNRSISYKMFNWLIKRESNVLQTHTRTHTQMRARTQHKVLIAGTIAIGLINRIILPRNRNRMTQSKCKNKETTSSENLKISTRICVARLTTTHME